MDIYFRQRTRNLLKDCKEKHRVTSKLDEEISALKQELKDLVLDSGKLSMTRIEESACILHQKQSQMKKENHEKQDQNEREALEARVRKLESTNSKLVCKLMAFKSMQQRVKNLNHLCSQQAIFIQELKSSLDKQERQSYAQLRLAKAEQEDLMKNLTQDSSSKEIIHKLERSLTKELKRKNTEIKMISSTKKKIVRKTSKLAEYQNNEKLKEEIKKLSKTIKENNIEIKRAREENIHMEEEVLSLYEEIEENQNILFEMEKQFSALKEQNTELKGTIVNLNEELGKLKNESFDCETARLLSYPSIGLTGNSFEEKRVCNKGQEFHTPRGADNKEYPCLLKSKKGVKIIKRSNRK